MVDRTGKNNAGESPEAGETLDCLEWEAMLADRMDGTLAPEAEAAFAEHGRLCPGCGELLEQARQGQQWLKLLEEHAPAAPVDLLSRILARTQGAGHEADYPLGTASGAILPGASGRWGLPFLPPGAGASASMRGANSARLLMTGAMAVFSVALTLSVAGKWLTSVHAAELRPEAVQANVSRSFYGTKKQVVSFYENLRFVYEVESKMHELRRESDRTPVKPEAAPKQAPKAVGPAAMRPEPGNEPRNEFGNLDSAHREPGSMHPEPARSEPRRERGNKRPESGERRASPVERGPIERGPAIVTSYRSGPPALRERTSVVRSISEATTLRGATSKERNRI